MLQYYYKKYSKLAAAELYTKAGAIEIRKHFDRRKLISDPTNNFCSYSVL